MEGSGRNRGEGSGYRVFHYCNGDVGTSFAFRLRDRSSIVDLRCHCR